MRGIFSAMTPAERDQPELLNASRRARIAAGAGVTSRHVWEFIKQFDQSRQMMHVVGKLGVTGKGRLMYKLTLDPYWKTPDPQAKSRVAWVLSWIALAVATVLLLKQLIQRLAL